MTTKVEKTILVNVPLSVAYNQWTQFEEFPHFMGGVSKVTQTSDDTLHWVAQIGGVKRQWDARILEQVPDSKVAWATTEGATNAGAVTFEDVGGGQTQIHLSLEYEPTGIVEKVGDKLDVVENQAEADLERFKAFVEAEGYATGAWRGTLNPGAAVGSPGVEAAVPTEGDSGKAGLSGKAVAAGIGLVAGAAAAAVAAATPRSERQADDVDVAVPVEPIETVEPVTYATTTADTEPLPYTGTDPLATDPVLDVTDDDTVQGDSGRL